MMSENATATPRAVLSREQLIYALYEAAELEHNLMCTYLYAGFSLRAGEAEGLSTEEAAAVARWRSAIQRVAIDEMGHLAAVWNITSALGATPRFGRANFPLDAGLLPASVVVRLAPFNAAVLQHFIHLERPMCSSEPDGDGFAPELHYVRGSSRPRITPMACDYETVGEFYTCLGEELRAFAEQRGERVAFCGDPALQLSPSEIDLSGAQPVICSKTALAAFKSIVEQGEGAPEHMAGSHFQSFVEIRSELALLEAKNPAFSPAFPAAVNPVLRVPIRREGRVWLENEEAAATVDVANSSYALMLRLMAYCYAVPRPAPEKALALDLALGLMRAVVPLAEHAARLPAGPSNPGCNAGMSFTTLRDASPLPVGAGARRFFSERLDELARAAARLEEVGAARVLAASRQLAGLAKRAARGFEQAASASVPQPAAREESRGAAEHAAASNGAADGTGAANGGSREAAGAHGESTETPERTLIDGVERVEGKKLTLLYEAKKCIHARFCVTGAPKVFLANVEGPWIHPDAMDVEALAGIAHVCPSGAIRYARKDGRPDETAPPVNLIAVREAGPYAVRGELRLNGEPSHFRATLCRCGASKNKPYCDGSHHEVGFSASGEPATGAADMLPVRDGPLDIAPQIDGPLQVRGNLEITSGTGRVVARLTSARLCRCGGSANKPFCDGTHARIGFKAD
jgi:CDGSH-type Zn-finger protein/uncharacterized Fe-S cluster protein YjdI